MQIRIAETDQEIADCYPVMSQLRPQHSKDDFVRLVRELMQTQVYKLVYLKTNEINAVMGMRIGVWLHAGKYLDIDDLVTCATHRSQGYGAQLLEWAKDYARAAGCNHVRLVSGIAREQAHKFYERNGMTFEAKYFSLCV